MLIIPSSRCIEARSRNDNLAPLLKKLFERGKHARDWIGIVGRGHLMVHYFADSSSFGFYSTH